MADATLFEVLGLNAGMGDVGEKSDIPNLWEL